MMGDAKRFGCQAKAHKMKAGTMGLAEGYQPRVLDMIERGHEAWGAMDQDGIVRCGLAHMYSIMIFR